MQPLDSFTLKDLFSRENLPSLIGALALLGAAYVAEHFANNYAFEISLRPSTNNVGDIVLDNIPVVDLNFLVIEIALIAIVIVILFVFSNPRHILFSLKALALFIIIRAFFISLTHVGIHPEQIEPGFGFFDSIFVYLNMQTGLFFSGHTGMPFLFALIFWKHSYARNALITLSVLFGVAVLFTHIHYSIDVFAAPFIAYGIYKIAQKLFPRDWALIS